MKKIFLIFFIINSIFLSAQNYKLINTTDGIFYKAINPFTIENYFTPHTRRFIISINNDSVISNINQTIYYPNRTITKIDSSYCFNINSFNWLGKKIIEESNGNNLLFNKNGDSILIKTAVNINDIWTFYKFNDNSIIEAKIINITNDSIFNITDSVKTISLTHVDSLGNIVTDLINNVTIKISKNYGFINFFAFRDFPSTIQEFEINGIQSLNSGNYIPTLAEIYSFMPGDELDYNYNSITGDGSIDNEMPFQEIRIILNKNIYLDSLTYSYDRTRFFFLSNFYLHDTVFVTVNYKDSLPNFIENTINKVPMQSIYINNDNFGQYSMNDEDYNYHLTLQFPEMSIQRDFNDTSCFAFLIPRKNNKFINWTLYENTKYIKGLGIVRTKLTGITCCDMPNYACNPCEELIYYNVQGQIWGNQLKINSNSYFKEDITLFPNPASEKVDITSNSLISEIILYNTLGKKINSFNNIKSNTYTINIQKLSKGLYFLNIKTINETFMNKKLIVK